MSTLEDRPARVPMCLRRRPWTADRVEPGGGRTIRVKRVCNGCGVLLGDATEAECVGVGARDVTGECPFCSRGK